MAVEYKGYKLDKFQEEAVAAVDRGESVVVCAPTGAGKTLIAEYLMDTAFREKRRLIYTAPIKAISNQKFRDFGQEHGGDIGLVTGDISVNPHAQVVIMTTEIFRNTIFDEPERLDDVGYVVFDEVHYMDNEERGTVWEESIIFAPKHIRFLCLSATIANLDKFAAWIGSVRHNKVTKVTETHRPVPLAFHIFTPEDGIVDIENVRRVLYAPKSRRGKSWAAHKRWLQKTSPGKHGHHYDDDTVRAVKAVRAEGHFPCLYFAFARKDCEAKAAKLARDSFLEPEEQARALALFDSLCNEFGISRAAGAEMRGLVENGVAYHHGGMLPAMKEVVEQLFASGLVKLLFATETFALGVNMPAASVVFDTLQKFDGKRRRYLLSGEFHQMAGRAGRRGMDNVGHVYAKVDKKFDVVSSVEGVINGEINPINSRFDMSYASILNLYGLLGNKIFRASEQSFGTFRSSKRERYVRKQQLTHRLELLQKMNYIDESGLTGKGRFAARLYGYELVLTELYFNGFFEGLSVMELAVLLTAVAFEPKKKCRYNKPGRDLVSKQMHNAAGLVDQIISMEKAYHIKRTYKPIYFELTETVRAWFEDSEFDNLSETTDAYDGDIVRAFRMTIQLCRQCLRAVAEDEIFGATLRGCMKAFNRDEVNAAILLGETDEYEQETDRTEEDGES